MTLRVRNLEALKWVGLLCMLADHFGAYVLGFAHPALEFAGALALPLFVIALASGLSFRDIDFGYRVAGRLAAWGVVAQGFALLVRDPLPLNILFTLAGGVLLHLSLCSRTAALTARLAIAGAVLVLSLITEFGAPGVLLTFGGVWLVRSPSFSSVVVFLLGLFALVPLNGAGFAVFACLPAVAAIHLLPRDLPRLRGFFYYAYCLQFPLFALLAVGFSAFGVADLSSGSAADSSARSIFK